MPALREALDAVQHRRGDTRDDGEGRVVAARRDEAASGGPDLAVGGALQPEPEAVHDGQRETLGRED